jgi:hypothetical protein
MFSIKVILILPREISYASVASWFKVYATVYVSIDFLIIFSDCIYNHLRFWEVAPLSKYTKGFHSLLRKDRKIGSYFLNI